MRGIGGCLFHFVLPRLGNPAMTEATAEEPPGRMAIVEDALMLVPPVPGCDHLILEEVAQCLLQLRTLGTPAGSVVIGGDAGNDVPLPPRSSSASEQVERLAKGADVIVHSTIHPAMGPDKGSGFFPHAYFRQSNAFDLGAMAKRAGAKYLMLTHMIPPLGAEKQGPFKVPGGPLTEADYRKAAEDSGFTGKTIVGTDLATLRLPPK